MGLLAEICMLKQAEHCQAMPQLTVPSIIEERSLQVIPMARFSLLIFSYSLRVCIASRSTLRAIAIRLLHLDWRNWAGASLLRLTISTSQLQLPILLSVRTPA